MKLLSESKDPVVLAVAAHDVGQYVKHYDSGKKWVVLFNILQRRLIHHV